MTKEQITALEKTVDDLTKKLDELNKVSDQNAELAKQLDAAKADLKKATDAAAAAKADADALKAKAEMDDEEKEFFDGLKDEDEEKKEEKRRTFLGKSKADRKAEIIKARGADETLTIGKATIRKSVVGADTFAFMKAQQEEVAKAQKLAADERDQRETTEYTKRAETELGNLPGTAAQKVPVLKAIAAMPEDAQKQLNEMLAAGDKAIKGAFASIGHGGHGDDTPDIVKAKSTFEKHVSDIQSAEKVSKMVATQKARTKFPDAFKAAFPAYS